MLYFANLCKNRLLFSAIKTEYWIEPALNLLAYFDDILATKTFSVGILDTLFSFKISYVLVEKSIKVNQISIERDRFGPKIGSKKKKPKERCSVFPLSDYCSRL